MSGREFAGSEFPAMGELLPHGHPMLALDRLEEWRDGFARARMTIAADDPLVHGDRVASPAALEYMAQAVGACLGRESYTLGESIRVGMVVACRDLVVERDELLVGETFFVEVERVRGAEHTSLFATRMFDEQGQPVARSTMTLVHGERPPN